MPVVMIACMSVFDPDKSAMELTQLTIGTQILNCASLQVKYPENFFLLIGNHECASINRIYGFYDECKRRYNIRLWKTFTDCFNCLPVAALVDEKVLCSSTSDERSSTCSRTLSRALHYRCGLLQLHNMSA